MQALIISAHGSRRAASNAEVHALVERLRPLAASPFSMVAAAFLELAEPDIACAVSQCVGAGATEIIAVPYLLSAGMHVAQDIPNALTAAQAEHPGLQIHLRAHLGAHPGIAPMLLESALSG